jgi:hypothetical protein
MSKAGCEREIYAVMAYRKVPEVSQELIDRCDKAVAEIGNHEALEIVRIVMSQEMPAGWTMGRMK